MNRIKNSLFFTLALYVAVWVAFLLNDRFSHRSGANDIDQELFTFVFSILAISIFFIRSVYQAIRVDESYWLVVAAHVACVFIVMNYFTN